MATTQLLETRSDSHGKFADNADITIRVMAVFETSPRWHNAPSPVKVAIFMIVHKISRALSGSLLFDDHWKDVQGYAKLVENICPKGKTLPQSQIEITHTNLCKICGDVTHSNCFSQICDRCAKV